MEVLNKGGNVISGLKYYLCFPHEVVSFSIIKVPCKNRFALIVMKSAMLSREENAVC